MVIATMHGEHSNQSSFWGVICEDVIPADDLLGELAGAVDFSFVSELVRDCYCPDNGRPSWNPFGAVPSGILAVPIRSVRPGN